MFSAIILAGGRSSRMGTDKAQLPMNGLPLWLLQQVRLQQAGCDDIQLSHPQLGTPDQQAGHGPLSGLHTLLPFCKHERVLVLAVDMPWMTAALLRTLIHHSQEQPVFFKDHYLPCVLQNSSDLQSYIAKQLHEKGRRSVGALLSYCAARAIPCPSPQLLLNTNTPEDWQLACHASQGGH